MNLHGEPSSPEPILQRLRDPAEALATVRGWVQQGQVEDLYLDFTRKDTPDNGLLDTNDKRGYAKALSGFANSDGGLLVWGVVAEKAKHDPQSKDAAKSLEPISPLGVFLGELNSILYYSTKPVVAGVENVAVPEPPNSDRGYVLTHIPAGTNPPYRAENDNNNNYYKRSGSSFYAMEPYDIRDVVFRFRYPKIELALSFDSTARGESEHHYALQLGVTNQGPSILKDYYLEVVLPEVCFERMAPPWSRHRDTSEGGVALALFSLPTSSCRPGLFEVYPGMTRHVLGREFATPLRYKMNRSIYMTAVMGSYIRCTLYGVDMPPLKVERPLSEMHDF